MEPTTVLGISFIVAAVLIFVVVGVSNVVHRRMEARKHNTPFAPYDTNHFV